MIILPDRNIPRAKFLLPMARKLWQRLPPHVIGQTWVAQLFHADYSMVWQGHFEDREDADEFMAAMFAGTLKNDGYLQRLPIHCPNFDPHLLDDPSISYNMVTNIGIGESSGNWTAPGDCVGLRGLGGEFIDALSGGGSGGVGNAGASGSGGGGGGFAAIYGLSLSPGQAVAYSVGGGGAAVARSGPTGGTNGNAGAETWFYNTSTLRVAAGGAGSGGQADLGGGGAGFGIAGATGQPGGAGGFASGAGGSCAAGGGGCGGPNGAGSAGATAAAFSHSNGGNGNGNQIGGGGPAAAGGTGNWYGPWGPGGGGGGHYASGANAQGGYGGPYGSGGGGARADAPNTATSGWGMGGLLVIRYEPVTQHTVTSITPTSGSTLGGTAVSIGGTNFDGSLNAGVAVGGVSLTSISIPSTTQITGNTAAHAAGLVNVTVAKTGATLATGTNLYTYVTPPAVTSCSPNVGPDTGGTAVTITGTNLSGVTSVTFGGTAATSVVVVNATTVTCVAPAHATGLVSVVATNAYGSGTGTNVYTYGLLATVSSCSPDIGLIFGNTLVTLTGVNFTGTTVVRFGGSNATSVSVTNSTTLTCRTPAHAKGLVSVDVTNTYGLGTGNNVFTYLLPASGFNMPMMGV